MDFYRFKAQFTKIHPKTGVRSKNAAFYRKFGNMPIMQAYKIDEEEHQLYMKKYNELRAKINNFEYFLRKQGAKCVQSKKSESLYYYF